MSVCTIRFLPLDRTVDVDAGTSLLAAAGEAGIVISSTCGGDAVCGRCKMVLKQGKVSGDTSLLLSDGEISQGVVLACQARVQSDLVVEIPEGTRAGDRVDLDEDAQRFRAVQPGITRKAFSRSPLVSRVQVTLEAPSLDSNFADQDRLEDGVEKATGLSDLETGLDVVRRLPELLREHDFSVTATLGRHRAMTEIIDVQGGDAAGQDHLVVVDVGTSTLVAHLVRASDGQTVATRACFNSQSVHGREVTMRIIASEKEGVKALQELVVGDINRLVSDLAELSGVGIEDMTGMVCAGNTTMSHFLLGLSARNLRREPYIAASVSPEPLPASELGLAIHPKGLLYTVPSISGWVGGDLTAGILATGLHEREETAMLIDVGTNGEIILGNKDWLMACSASTGPALEGASVACGMMAETGAIEKISVVDDAITCKVIGDVAPVGLCGSAIIDLLAVLLDRGIIDRGGKFVEGSDPAVRFEKGIGRFALVAEGGDGKEVFVTQDDIDNVITAKAAVFAAAKIMLDRLNIEVGSLDKVFLAGGFGSFIDRANAVKIGLLPDLPLAKIEYVGNTSLWGAKIAALSFEANEELHEIRAKTTYYDLMGSDDYVEQFQQASFLPHTDIGLFPSVA